VATLNSVDGRSKSNAAIVAAGAEGAVSVYGTNNADVIMDINGYFVSPATSRALAFYPLAPCRVVDTRMGRHWAEVSTAGQAGRCRCFSVPAKFP
jgi:hypothetical protein